MPRLPLRYSYTRTWLFVLKSLSKIACLLVLVGGGSPVFAQSFATPVDYPTASSPYAAVLGDFNGDGIRDMATANNSARSISVLLGNGVATFGAKTDYDLGSGPEGIVTMDLNGDGKLDLAAASYFGLPAKVSVLLGNGNGTFQNRVDYTFTGLPEPNSILSADFNGDSKPDLVVANTNGVTVFLGNGDGTLSSPVNYGSGNFVGSVTVGDFNLDGKIDLAFPNYGVSNNSVVSVMLGTGNGTFQTQVDYPVATSPFAIGTTDLNGDGKPDLVTVNLQVDSISVLLGNGNGTFQSAANYPTAPSPYGIAFGDLNVDGKVDVLVAGNGGRLSIHAGNGNGTFGGPITYQAGGSFVTVSDLNGDSKPDIVSAGPQNSVSVLLNQVGPHSISGVVADVTMGTPLSGVSVLLSGATPILSTTGNDGAYSFIGLTAGGSYVVTPSKQNYGMVPVAKTFNNLSSSQVANFNAAPVKYIISGVVRDLNGVAMSGVTVTLAGGATASTTSASDGAYSFPPVPAGGNYSVSASQTGFTFSSFQITNLTGPRNANFTGSTGSPVTYRISGLVKDSLTNFALFNSFVTLSGADRGGFTFPASQGEYFFSDLPAGNSYTVSVSTFKAGAHFSRLIGPPPQTFSNLSSDITANFFGKILDYPLNFSPNQITSGDYNADGNLDVVVSSGGTSGILQVFLGNGAGGLASPVNYPVGCSPAALVTADFDRDGKLDLAATNTCSNTVSISRGNGDGTFRAPQSFTTQNESIALLAGDWNNDTIIDLAILNGICTNCHTISLFMGVGDGTFGPPTTFSSPETISLTAGDMDNDGDIDLISGKSSNKINVLYRAANGTYVAGLDYPVPATPSRLVVGDLNGDGLLDVVTSSSNASNISVVLAIPGSAFGSATSFPIGGFSNALTISDFNGDGKLDLASSISSGSSLASLLGNGDGTFQAAASNITSGGGTGALTVGDFNNDGKRDLAVVSSVVSLMLNVTRNSPPLKISGTVTTPSGTPLSGVAMTLAGSQQATTTADANGNFVFNNLQAGGSFLVTASQTVYTSAPQGRMFNDLNTDQVSNFTMTLPTPSIVGRVTDTNGVGLAGVAVNLSGSQTASVVTNANGIYSFFNLPGGGNYVVTPTYGSVGFAPANRTISNLSFNTTQDFRATLDRSIQLDAFAYTVSEGTGSVQISVMRAGDTSAPASVEYSTSDAASANNCGNLNGAASSRCDYQATVGTIQFAAGESAKTLAIPIVDDAYAEGTETFKLTLSNAKGGSLGLQNLATISIFDNETTDGLNPLSQANFFVHQHYVDFLNREPDASGLAFWSNQITECQQPGATCNAEVRRINVSAAFFLSIEFQETGYLVERLYKAAYGDAVGTSNFGPTHQLAVPIVRLNEFLPDTQEIGRGVVVGQTGWEQVLESNKVAFTLQFVQRSRFTTAFPTSITPAQFVDQLFARAGLTPSVSERTSIINEFGGAGTSADNAARGRALRRVAENSTLNQAEKNRAFVLMQFFGYLRRNPNDPQDTDYTGYDFWLTKLAEHNGNYIEAEMVKAFLDSTEYRARFGP